MSKSLLLAAFIVSDLNSGHLSDPIHSYLGHQNHPVSWRFGPSVPNRGQVANVYDDLQTRIYTEQIPASSQFGRSPDWCVLTPPVEYEHFCG